MALEINMMIVNYTFMLVELNHSITQFLLIWLCLTFQNEFSQDKFYLFIDFQ